MHVDSQLSSLLISLLKHYHVIELSGLGVIERHSIAATMDSEHHNKTVILPPQLGFIFRPDHKIVANTLLLARSEDLLEDLDYEALLTFVNTLHHQSQTDQAILVSNITPQEKYLIPVEVEAIKNENVPHPSEVLAVSAASDEQLLVQQQTATDQNLPITKKEVITVTSDEKGWINSVLALLLLVAGIFGLTVIYKQCATQAKESQTPQTEIKELTRAKDDINPLEVDEPVKIFDNPRLEKYRHVLTQAIIKDGCKITVGSFREERNAINMMERVLTEGYNSEILPFDGGSRVIITFDCLAKDLDDYLITVKETIAPNAWYLQPDYEPVLD